MVVDNYRIIVQNRRARFEYFIEQEYEAGIVLQGSEIKSLRSGGASIDNAHIELDSKGEVYIYNFSIAKYRMATVFNHEPNSRKKLLLRRREIDKIAGKIKLRGFTCIPLVLYFNSRNYAKIKIALAKGKKLYDRRESIKERDIEREEARVVKQRLIRADK